MDNFPKMVLTSRTVDAVAKCTSFSPMYSDLGKNKNNWNLNPTLIRNLHLFEGLDT